MTARKPADGRPRAKPRPAKKAPETLAGSAEVREFVTFIRDMLNEFRDDLAKQQDDNEQFRRGILNERIQQRHQVTMAQSPPPSTAQVSGELQQKVQQVMARQYTGLHIVRALEAFMAALPVNPGTLRGITPDQIYDAILQGAARADQELSEGHSP